MKKILMLSSALFLLTSHAATAQISVILGEPIYVEPPVYSAPPVYAPGYLEYNHRYPSQYYDNHRHHRQNDWAYWAKQRREKEEEHEHHDNGNHGEGNRRHDDHGHR